MIWNGFQRKKIIDAGAKFRAEHSRFLTLALLSNKKYPKIPSKRVDLGGYSGLMKLTEGEKRAALWWAKAIDRVDLPRD
ncbi:MAG: hypothetical protein P1U42_01215 [Phycisphaerales bacterium]|nr:hypothetical protein [Phycisphaerales bacterium]